MKVMTQLRLCRKLWAIAFSLCFVASGTGTIAGDYGYQQPNGSNRAPKSPGVGPRVDPNYGSPGSLEARRPPSYVPGYKSPPAYPYYPGWGYRSQPPPEDPPNGAGSPTYGLSPNEIKRLRQRSELSCQRRTTQRYSGNISDRVQRTYFDECMNRAGFRLAAKTPAQR